MVVVPRIVPLIVTLPAAVLMVQSPPWALGLDSLIPPGGQIIVLVIRLSVIVVGRLLTLLLLSGSGRLLFISWSIVSRFWFRIGRL